MRRILLAGAIVVAATAAALAQDGPSGITTPTVFPPFDPDAAACTPPPGLEPVIAFAQDNEREFVLGALYGAQKAAEDRGLTFKAALADNDPTLMIEQVQQFVADKVGGLIVSPVDPGSLEQSLKAVLWSGAYVGTIVPPPATTILNAPQYLTGKELGDAAAVYIRDELGGKANVVLLTQDSIQFLTPRFVAIRDALDELPGVTIVADISPTPVDNQGGYQTMSTILLVQPNIDVVLGADSVVLGALKALREAGRDRPDQFLGGIDGEPEAVAEIKAGGPYKTTISLNSPVFGYAMGQHAADWIAGKSVPQAMDILPRAISVENLAAYEADLADPAAVYANPQRRDSYLKMYGNICYDSRDQYVAFPWSSETK